VALDTGDLQRRLSVADHGTGLSDADKQLAVRRFWRGSSTTAGTGLGLAIATALAAQSGGSLALTDATGGGLAAVLTLRAARPATGDVIAGTDGAPRPSTAARTMKA